MYFAIDLGILCLLEYSWELSQGVARGGDGGVGTPHPTLRRSDMQRSSLTPDEELNSLIIYVKHLICQHTEKHSPVFWPTL